MISPRSRKQDTVRLCQGNVPEVQSTFRSYALSVLLLLPVATALFGYAAVAQTAPAPAGRQIGTVKTVTPNKLNIVTDAGLAVSVNVVDGAKVLQLAPGSTDLKAAQVITLGDIEVGDRVLVTGHTDAPDALTASRVILMKSNDIAQKHAAEAEDWQKRGTGGLVSAVDPSTGTVTITARAKKIAVETTPATVYRRYADGSVKFEDAKIGSLSQIQPGDQLRVRGQKSDDGGSIKAEEIVSGSFKNLAGTIIAVDAAAGTLTIKDLVARRLIPQGDGELERSCSATGGCRTVRRAGKRSATGRDSPCRWINPRRRLCGDGPFATYQSAAQGALSDLHPGEALMIVASQPESGSDSLTAITLLSGVEPILAATPKGEASMTLSPWSLSGGTDGGGI